LWKISICKQPNIHNAIPFNFQSPTTANG
jgi:hypothetical protein